MTEDRFHNDESSWKVFESVEGKIGNRWWLWVSRSASVVFFQIAPGRGADVPVEHFKNIESQKIIIEEQLAKKIQELPEDYDINS